VSSTVSVLIAAVTLANIAAALWLLWWTSKRRGEASGPGETTGHVWDGDLQEYNNPLPRWWLWLFVITAVFGLAYLALYPGLGTFGNTKGWSQIEQYEQQSAQAEAVLAKTFAPFAVQSVAQLERDPGALRVGRNLFLNNCATCHGSDGRGAPGFPNLADSDWLWGGDPDTVLASIQNGRAGMMMPWREVLGSQGTEDMLAYVLSLTDRPISSGTALYGKEKFGQLCFACHGADGRGNPQLGAPNLTDNVWLHGGSIAAVRDSIARGRNGQMPAHLERLGETRTKLLAAYVLSLSAPQADPPLQASTATSTK
jgi:cytochrome c oxidase cbb3-type subunit III